MTVSRPDIALPIDVRGDICFDAPTGRPVTLKATGSELCLSAPGWAELNQLGPRSLLSQRRALAATLSSLTKLRLKLEVDIGGRRALALGPGVRTSLLARLLGLPSADIRFATVVSLLRSRASTR